MKKSPKKETVLSVLKDIRDLLKASKELPEMIAAAIDEHTDCKEIINLVSQKLPENGVRFNPEKEYLIYFPPHTMQEIVNLCENKKADGTPLLWPSQDWYKTEDFYLKETCREGWKIVPKELIGKGKTWKEQEEMLPKGTYRPNAAEALYMMYAIEKATGKRTWEYEWCWTSSRSSDGRLVGLGDFDDSGLHVISDDPRYCYDNLGASFFRSVSGNDGK